MVDLNKPFTDGKIVYSYSKKDATKNGARDFYSSAQQIADLIKKSFNMSLDTQEFKSLNVWGGDKDKTRLMMPDWFCSRVSNTLYEAIDVIYPIDRIEFAYYNNNKIDRNTGNFQQTNYNNEFTHRSGSHVVTVPFMVIHFMNQVDLVYPLPRPNWEGKSVTNVYPEKPIMLGKCSLDARKINQIIKYANAEFVEYEGDPSETGEEKYTDEHNITRFRAAAPSDAEVVGDVARTMSTLFKKFLSEEAFQADFRQSMFTIRELNKDVPEEVQQHEDNKVFEINKKFAKQELLDTIVAVARDNSGIYDNPDKEQLEDDDAYQAALKTCETHNEYPYDTNNPTEIQSKLDKLLKYYYINFRYPEKNFRFTESIHTAKSKLILQEDDDVHTDNTPLSDLINEYDKYINNELEELLLRDLFVEPKAKENSWYIEYKNYPGHYLTKEHCVSEKNRAYFNSEQEAIDFAAEDGEDWEKYYEVVKA